MRRFDGLEDEANIGGCSQIWNDDDSIYSSSHSPNLDKLDALIECQQPSSSLANTSPKRKITRDPEGYTYTSLPPVPRSKPSRIPPPGIPDVFKNTKPLSFSRNAIPPPEIPEVFLNATHSSGSVPPDVFTNPNYWLPWTSSTSSSTSSNIRKNNNHY